MCCTATGVQQRCAHGGHVVLCGGVCLRAMLSDRIIFGSLLTHETVLSVLQASMHLYSKALKDARKVNWQ